MELRMKNFNIWAITEKSDFQRGISQKADKEEGLPKKGGAWTVCRFKGGGGGLSRKRGWYFLRGWLIH